MEIGNVLFTPLIIEAGGSSRPADRHPIFYHQGEPEQGWDWRFATVLPSGTTLLSRWRQAPEENSTLCAV